MRRVNNKHNKNYDFNLNDFTPYIPPKLEELKKNKVKFIFLVTIKNGILKKVITTLMKKQDLNLTRKEQKEVIQNILV